MTENERFTIIQNGDNFTVRDNLKNKPMGTFTFKENEFPVYFCFHKIIDLLNELNDECDFLKVESESAEHAAAIYAELSHKVLKENKQLKERISELEKELNSLSYGEADWLIEEEL